MNTEKYKKMYYDVPEFNRTWPDKVIDKAPIWCSVDLRDGNQALFSPMTLEEKTEFFTHLVNLGFKQIEVGFPAASDTEYTFIRKLIDEDLVPDDVYIQVLTQARKHIIDKTIEAVRGVKNIILHIYIPTSTIQRKVVLRKNREGITRLAVESTLYLKELSKKLTDNGSNVKFEFSPESFTCTEMPFALNLCNEVLDALQPDENNRVIINLPATIEVSTPNVFADETEYISQNLKYREFVDLSVHTHNDRGCAVAASELALLAGANRVEGTLFGNGERTGNADIAAIALNMFSHGIDPKLDFSKIEESVAIFERINKMPLNPRQTYAGELAYTAFSGSHQDAIKKCMDNYEKESSGHWNNPYITIDPKDIGRTYEPIQINSQSGHGGLHYIMENKFGLTLPKFLLMRFSEMITDISDNRSSVLEPNEIFEIFENEYINLSFPIELINYSLSMEGKTSVINADIRYNDDEEIHFTSEGNGPLDAFTNGIKKQFNIDFELSSYSEHAVARKSNSNAAAYISITAPDGKIYWGAGLDPNINTASINALISAVDKML